MSFVIIALSFSITTSLSLISLNYKDNLKLRGNYKTTKKLSVFRNISTITLYISSLATIWVLDYLGFINPTNYLFFLGFALLYIGVGVFDFQLNSYRYASVLTLTLLSFLMVYAYKEHFANYYWGIAFLDWSVYTTILAFTAVIVGIIQLLIVIDNLYPKRLPLLAFAIVLLFCCFDVEQALASYYLNLSIIAALMGIISIQLFINKKLVLSRSAIYLLGFYFSIYLFHSIT
jgi:hypothetical protein